MKKTANVRFSIKSWDERPYSEGEGLPKMTRASVDKTFSGDIEGEGHVEYVTHDARFDGQPMLSAMRTMHAIPVATAIRAPRSPFAVATRSSSPASSPVPEFATRTRRARPIALPTPLAVDAMPAATP